MPYLITTMCYRPDHFYNKPRGFQHWLQHTQGEMAAETIIALVDPDFVFLRPLDGRVRGANNSIFSSSYKPADMDFDFVTKVLSYIS